jgi:hypothetical protein
MTNPAKSRKNGGGVLGDILYGLRRALIRHNEPVDKQELNELIKLSDRAKKRHEKQKQTARKQGRSASRAKSSAIASASATSKKGGKTQKRRVQKK